jgi:hypothetical protein
MICDWDMRVVFVLSGWEGSANDGRIYRDAVDRHSLRIREPYYLLADAGFGASFRLLVPYRGVRYHLAEWEKGQLRPQTPEELFNLRHSQMRITIEKVFGRLKGMFCIFRQDADYDVRPMTDIIVAAVAVMNFCIDAGDTTIDRYNLDDKMLFQTEIDTATMSVTDFYNVEERRQGRKAAMNVFRDKVRDEMWEQYQNTLRIRGRGS